MDKLVIGMLAHVDAGKTTLSEALLYTTGAIRRLGRVDNKDAYLDTDRLERARGITIFSKQAALCLEDLEVTLLDTPGHVDFSAEMERTLQVLDYAILVISGADGVQGHTQTLWRLLHTYKVPVFLFVNKMDQPGASEERIMEQLKQRLSGNCVDFTKMEPEDIALCDEALLVEYLDTLTFDQEHLARLIAARRMFPCFFGSALKLEGIRELLEGIRKYMVRRTYPEAFGARVYKIARDAKGERLTYLKVTGGTLKAKMQLPGGQKVNQIRIYSGERYTGVSEAEAGTICAVTGVADTRPGQGLGIEEMSEMPVLAPLLNYRLLLPDMVTPLEFLPRLRQLEEEIPELHVQWKEELSEIQVQIMGAVQMEVLACMIRDRLGVEVSFDTGSIIYKETITESFEGVGHFEPLRHYAEVHLLLEPLERGSGLMFATDCSEDLLDKNWQRLVLTHLFEREFTGPLTNSPITDMKITLVAGRAHPKHTEGGDFRQATYRAVRNGLMQAQACGKMELLEPYYEFRLELPDQYVGRAMTDLEQKNADFALEQNAQNAVLTGSVPAALLADYQKEVLSYTGGTGQLSCSFKGFDICHNPQEVIENRAYDADRDTMNPAGSVFCAHGAGMMVEWDEVFSYMHLESVLEKRRLQEAQGDGSQPETVLSNVRRSEKKKQAEEIWLGTEEIDEILNQTYYSNARKEGNARKKLSRHNLEDAPKTYRAREEYWKPEDTYLLVDGYNVIFAWEELNSLAKSNLDGARGKLLDILCNYQGLTKYKVMAVFDAYRVKGHDTECLDYHNIQVVYTKEAQTADSYIERFAHEHSPKYHILVVTSDGLEQMIIRGAGCRLWSSREFQEQVEAENEKMRQMLNNRQGGTDAGR